VAAVRGSNRGNPRSMARRCKPVVNRGADSTTLDGRLACPSMTGNQQNDAFIARNRPLQRNVDRIVGAVEIVTVEIERPVRANRPRLQPAVPPAVERIARHRLGDGDDHPAR
jgi:hypothetical protein